MIDKPLDFTGPMLAVTVHLDGNVIAVQGGVAITGLHRPADSEIKWQTDDGGVRRYLAKRVIGGSIVDDQHIKIGKCALKAMGELADGLAFVECRDNHQAS